MKEEMLKLPQEIQEAINAFNWATISEEIGKKYFADEEAVNSFQTETGLVLAGLVDPALYAQNIENEVGTSKDEAEKIANEAVKKIFEPMGNKIESVLKSKGKDQEADYSQNINFILSGGNYMAFLERRTDNPDEKTPTNNTIIKTETPKENLLVNFLKKEDVKSKFNI